MKLHIHKDKGLIMLKMLQEEHNGYVRWCLKNNKVPQTFDEFVNDVIRIGEDLKNKKRGQK